MGMPGWPKQPAPVSYPVNLDIGEVAHGHHLIVLGITLSGASLILEWTFTRLTFDLKTRQATLEK